MIESEDTAPVLGVYRPDLPSWLTIVPEAHVRILDRALQLEMYAVFHIHWVCRLGHLLATPVILAATMALAQSLAGPWGLAAAMGLAGLQVANAARLDRLVAVVVALKMLALLLVSTAAAGLSAGVLLGVILTAALAQAASHSIEPVPPPWSDHPGWERLGVLNARHGFSRIPGYVALFTTSVFLELWAAYRISAYQVLQLLLLAGHRPTLAGGLSHRQALILADHRHGWGPDAKADRRVSL